MVEGELGALVRMHISVEHGDSATLALGATLDIDVEQADAVLASHARPLLSTLVADIVAARRELAGGGSVSPVQVRGCVWLAAEGPWVLEGGTPSPCTFRQVFFFWS